MKMRIKTVEIGGESFVAVSDVSEFLLNAANLFRDANRQAEAKAFEAAAGDFRNAKQLPREALKLWGLAETDGTE